MSEQLYHFFNSTNNHDIDEKYIINLTIDNQYEDLYYIYDYFGKVICNKTGYVNDILPTLKTYFGTSTEGFIDCLRNCLEEYPKYHLKFHILSKHNDIPDPDFFMFVNILLLYKTEYSEKSISVFMSMDIMKWYYNCAYLFVPKEEYFE